MRIHSLSPLSQGEPQRPINPPTNLFAFTLGREWKLSLAELFAIFGNDAYQTHTETVAIFQIPGYSDEQLAKKFLTIGGSIRIIKILGETDEKRFPTDVIGYLTDSKAIKADFALGAYGVKFRLSDIGLRIKKTLMERGISARLVNQKNENINAASFKKEKLGKTGNEYSIIAAPVISTKETTQLSETLDCHTSLRSVRDDGKYYIGRSLACQDIDAYAKRDTNKSRDMVVGMMPPKLVQMMINLAGWRGGGVARNTSLTQNQSTNPPIHQPAIYDPFCGLGTTLIEAANMGITHVYGSDISKEMVTSSRESLERFIEGEKVWQERIKVAGGIPNKDFANFQSDVFELDARDIARGIARIFQSTNPPIHQSTLTIVSEGYLGNVMSPRDISLEKVQSERKNLASIYHDFLSGLTKANFRGNIVMSFPFWNLHGTYSYFTEIYALIEKHGFHVIPLLPEAMKLNTNKGSLLYRRESQTVGREILHLTKTKR